MNTKMLRWSPAFRRKSAERPAEAGTPTLLLLALVAVTATSGEPKIVPRREYVTRSRWHIVGALHRVER